MCNQNHMIYYTFKYYTLTTSLKSYLKYERVVLETSTIRLIIDIESNATLPFYAPMTAEAICLFLFAYKVKCGCWKHETIVIKLKTILKCVALIFV